MPYARYFVASVLTYQFHRALSKAAGCTAPLHLCSIYGSRAAGDQLQKAMALGASRPWPDVLEVIRDLAGTGRADGVLVCPQGFVSDHLEVVYDLDIEARRRADAAGLAFARTRVLNDDATVLAALADRVRAVAPA